MAFYDSYDPHANYRPLTAIGGFQLYLIQILVLAHVVGMVITAISAGAASDGFARSLGGEYGLLFGLNSSEVLTGQVWRLVTYAFVDFPGIWFVIILLMTFFTFGPEVEKYIGRKALVGLYAALILVPAIFVILLGAVTGKTLIESGASNVIWGFFIAFSTLYPGLVFNFFFFQLTMKLAAFILLGVNSLMYIAVGDGLGLTTFWLCAGTAFLGLKFLGVQGGFGKFTEWMENKRLERDAKRQKLKVLRRQEKERSIDEILDKISKQGIGSLTPEERATLERARSDLMKRDGGK